MDRLFLLRMWSLITITAGTHALLCYECTSTGSDVAEFGAGLPDNGTGAIATSTPTLCQANVCLSVTLSDVETGRTRRFLRLCAHTWREGCIQGVQTVTCFRSCARNFCNRDAFRPRIGKTLKSRRSRISMSREDPRSRSQFKEEKNHSLASAAKTVLLRRPRRFVHPGSGQTSLKDNIIETVTTKTILNTNKAVTGKALRNNDQMFTSKTLKVTHKTNTTDALLNAIYRVTWKTLQNTNKTVTRKTLKNIYKTLQNTNKTVTRKTLKNIDKTSQNTNNTTVTMKIASLPPTTSARVLLSAASSKATAPPLNSAFDPEHTVTLRPSQGLLRTKSTHLSPTASRNVTSVTLRTTFESLRSPPSSSKTLLPHKNVKNEPKGSPQTLSPMSLENRRFKSSDQPPNFSDHSTELSELPFELPSKSSYPPPKSSDHPSVSLPYPTKPLAPTSKSSEASSSSSQNTLQKSPKKPLLIPTPGQPKTLTVNTIPKSLHNLPLMTRRDTAPKYTQSATKTPRNVPRKPSGNPFSPSSQVLPRSSQTSHFIPTSSWQLLSSTQSRPLPPSPRHPSRQPNSQPRPYLYRRSLSFLASGSPSLVRFAHVPVYMYPIGFSKVLVRNSSVNAQAMAARPRSHSRPKKTWTSPSRTKTSRLGFSYRPSSREAKSRSPFAKFNFPGRYYGYHQNQDWSVFPTVYSFLRRKATKKVGKNSHTDNKIDEFETDDFNGQRDSYQHKSRQQKRVDAPDNPESAFVETDYTSDRFERILSVFRQHPRNRGSMVPKRDGNGAERRANGTAQGTPQGGGGGSNIRTFRQRGHEGLPVSPSSFKVRPRSKKTGVSNDGGVRPDVDGALHSRGKLVTKPSRDNWRKNRRGRTKTKTPPVQKKTARRLPQTPYPSPFAGLVTTVSAPKPSRANFSRVRATSYTSLTPKSEQGRKSNGDDPLVQPGADSGIKDTGGSLRDKEREKAWRLPSNADYRHGAEYRGGGRGGGKGLGAKGPPETAQSKQRATGTPRQTNGHADTTTDMLRTNNNGNKDMLHTKDNGNKDKLHSKHSGTTEMLHTKGNGTTRMLHTISRGSNNQRAQDRTVSWLVHPGKTLDGVIRVSQENRHSTAFMHTSMAPNPGLPDKHSQKRFDAKQTRNPASWSKNGWSASTKTIATSSVQPRSTRERTTLPLDTKKMITVHGVKTSRKSSVSEKTKVFNSPKSRRPYNTPRMPKTTTSKSLTMTISSPEPGSTLRSHGKITYSRQTAKPHESVKTLRFHDVTETTKTSDTAKTRKRQYPRAPRKFQSTKHRSELVISRRTTAVPLGSGTLRVTNAFTGTASSSSPMSVHDRGPNDARGREAPETTKRGSGGRSTRVYQMPGRIGRGEGARHQVDTGVQAKDEKKTKHIEGSSAVDIDDIKKTMKIERTSTTNIYDVKKAKKPKNARTIPKTKGVKRTKKHRQSKETKATQVGGNANKRWENGQDGIDAMNMWTTMKRLQSRSSKIKQTHSVKNSTVDNESKQNTPTRNITAARKMGNRTTTQAPDDAVKNKKPTVVSMDYTPSTSPGVSVLTETRMDSVHTSVYPFRWPHLKNRPHSPSMGFAYTTLDPQSVTTSTVTAVTRTKSNRKKLPKPPSNKHGHTLGSKPDKGFRTLMFGNTKTKGKARSNTFTKSTKPYVRRRPWPRTQQQKDVHPLTANSVKRISVLAPSRLPSRFFLRDRSFVATHVHGFPSTPANLESKRLHVKPTFSRNHKQLSSGEKGTLASATVAFAAVFVSLFVVHIMRA